MASGVEIRIPLLDHRIVDFAFSIPWSSKLRNGFTKAILRDAVAPLLPSGVVNRKEKIGFAPPIGDWMRGPLREYLLDETKSMSFRQASLIRPSHLSAAIDRVLNSEDSGNLYRVERIWKEFGIYLWEKVFLKNQSWKSDPSVQKESAAPPLKMQ
jgi:asparagine synthase (glutamine-hydrolysing)